MLIDWFTVGAQVLNFLVLVALLERFLYRPVLGAIDAREARIARQIADARQRQADADAARQRFEQQQQDFASERAVLHKRAVADAQAERERLLAAARQAADALAAQRRDALRTDAVRLQQALGERASREVFAIVRKAMAELAGAELEALVVDRFIARLAAIDGADREAFAAAIAAGGGALQVRSAFDLPPAGRQALEAALQQAFATPVTLQYETAPALLTGIALVAGGRQLAWGVLPYLAALEEAVGELLSPADAVTAATVPAATAAAAP